MVERVREARVERKQQELAERRQERAAERAAERARQQRGVGGPEAGTSMAGLAAGGGAVVADVEALLRKHGRRPWWERCDATSCCAPGMRLILPAVS